MLRLKTLKCKLLMHNIPSLRIYTTLMCRCISNLVYLAHGGRRSFLNVGRTAQTKPDDTDSNINYSVYTRIKQYINNCPRVKLTVTENLCGPLHICENVQIRHFSIDQRLGKPKRVTEDEHEIPEFYYNYNQNRQPMTILNETTNVAEFDACTDNITVNAEPNLHLRYVRVMTCEQKWEDIPGGLLFDVAYLDSNPGEDIDPNIPTILAIHGYPGSHENWRSFLMPFVMKGYRVIAPTFPGCGDTRGESSGDLDVFTHSPDVQAEFLCDFMANLHIPKVNLMIGHGSASNPAALVVAGSHCVDSLLLISPLAHNYWQQYFKSWGAYNVQRLHEYTATKPVAYLAALVYRRLNGLCAYPLTSVIAACKMLENAEFKQVRGSVNALGVTNYPALVVTYRDSSAATQAGYHEYAKILLSFENGLPYPKCMQVDGDWRVPSDLLTNEIEALIDYSRNIDGTAS